MDSYLREHSFCSAAVLCLFSLSISFFRPLIAILFVLLALTSFYMDQLGIVIDREMIQNVVTTTINEGKHLITVPFVLWVGLAGLLPAVLVLFIRLSHRGIVTSI